MNSIKAPVIAMILAVSATTQAAELKTLEQRASYSFGIDIYSNLKAQGVELETDALVQGIRDAAAGKDLSLGTEERNKAKQEYQAVLRDRLLAEQKQLGEKNRKAGVAFLADNKSKPGVVTTDSGLQYKIIKAGDGKKPKADDTVVTHYRGTLIDGREFDSSYSRNKPATFPVKGVIKGWTEALQLMKVGAKWELYVPSDLAYGGSKRGALIEPNSTLVFEVELLEIK